MKGSAGRETATPPQPTLPPAGRASSARCPTSPPPPQLVDPVWRKRSAAPTTRNRAKRPNRMGRPSPGARLRRYHDHPAHHSAQPRATPCACPCPQKRPRWAACTRSSAAESSTARSSRAGGRPVSPSPTRHRSRARGNEDDLGVSDELSALARRCASLGQAASSMVVCNGGPLIHGL